uniref:Ion_trans_2 domain-containing protein n=1 Tax=Parastrongyloides trichosuri TaxID=131310 RepID=A0A0N4ZB33_PARTI
MNIRQPAKLRHCDPKQSLRRKSKRIIMSTYHDNRRIQAIKNNIWLNILLGIFLNIIGCLLNYLRTEIDESMIQDTIDKKFIEYGMLDSMNKSIALKLRTKEFHTPSCIVRVMLTTVGRMCNVIGTMKIFKGFSEFLSEKKRLRLRLTTEKLIEHGEGEADFSEIFNECCQGCF